MRNVAGKFPYSVHPSDTDNHVPETFPELTLFELSVVESFECNLCMVFHTDKTMDRKLEDEQFCVCSNIQCGWISHVYSRRYVARTSLPFGVYPTMIEDVYYLFYTRFDTGSISPISLVLLQSRQSFLYVFKMTKSTFNQSLALFLNLYFYIFIYFLYFYNRFFCFASQFLSLSSPLQVMERCMFGI